MLIIGGGQRDAEENNNVIDILTLYKTNKGIVSADNLKEEQKNLEVCLSEEKNCLSQKKRNSNRQYYILIHKNSKKNLKNKIKHKKY